MHLVAVSRAEHVVKSKVITGYESITIPFQTTAQTKRHMAAVEFRITIMIADYHPLLNQPLAGGVAQVVADKVQFGQTYAHFGAGIEKHIQFLP